MSVDEDVKVLEAIRDYKQPSKLHPIAMHAYYVYEEAGDNLTDEGVQELREILAKLEDLKELTDALCGLTAFMIYLSEQLKDTESSEKVANLMKEQKSRYIPLQERAAEAFQNLSHKAKGVLERFFGKSKEDSSRAPVYDEEAPEGTVPLKNLKPVAQPPPWAKKKGK